MSSTPYFLTLNLDEDNLVTSQTGVSPSEVLDTIDAAPATAGYVVCGSGDSVNIENIPMNQLAAADLSLGSNAISCRNLTVGNQVSAPATCSVYLEGSVSAASVSADSIITETSASLSGMPIPAPYLWFRTSVDAADFVSEYYFGSSTGGETLTVNEFSFPEASSTLYTDGYLTIPHDGVYLVDAKLGVNVDASPTTVSFQIITTTGWGGSETILAMGTQVLNTAYDPGQGLVDYIGHFSSGTKIALKVLAGSPNNVKAERFSSVRIQRVA